MLGGVKIGMEKSLNLNKKDLIKGPSGAEDEINRALNKTIVEVVKAFVII